VRRFTFDTRPGDPDTLAQVRRLARKLRGKVDNGIDPQAEKKSERELAEAEKERRRIEANRLTVEGLSEKWLPSPEAKAWRPSTLVGFERFLSAEIIPAIGKRPAEDVRPPEVADFLDRITERSSSSAARCFEVVRAMFRWANMHRKSGAPVAVNNPC